MGELQRHRLNCCLPQDPPPSMKPNLAEPAPALVESPAPRHAYTVKQLLPTQRTIKELLTKNTTSSSKGIIETNSSVGNGEMQPLFLDIFICFTLDFHRPQKGSAIALIQHGRANPSGI